MSKSSENSKRGSSKKVSKAIGRHKDDKINSSEGARTQFGTSARTSIVGRTLKSSMKNLKKKNGSVDERGSNTDEDYMIFLRLGGWPTYVF